MHTYYLGHLNMVGGVLSHCIIIFASFLFFWVVREGNESPM